MLFIFLFPAHFSDTNECATNNGGCQQTCINTFGSFRCECNTGFQLRNDGRTCESKYQDKEVPVR